MSKRLVLDLAKFGSGSTAVTQKVTIDLKYISGNMNEKFQLFYSLSLAGNALRPWDGSSASSEHTPGHQMPRYPGQTGMCIKKILNQIARGIEAWPDTTSAEWGILSPDWGIKSTLLWHRVKVDSGIGLPNAHGNCVGVDSGVDVRWVCREGFLFLPCNN